MPRDAKRITVAGGGIIGVTSAYFMAKRAQADDEETEIVLLEKDDVGSGSTTRAAYGMRAYYTHATNVRFSQTSIYFWEHFEEQFEADIDFRKTGYLLVARSDEMARSMADHVTQQRGLGVPSRLVDPVDAVEYCPGLDPEPYTQAAYCPSGALADPEAVVGTLASAAANNGVDVRTGTPVRDVTTDDGTLEVTTPAGSFETDVLVNAAGSWSPSIGAMLGRDLNLTPHRRQLAVVEPARSVPESLPLTVDLGTGFYFRPERDGRAYVGGHFEEDDDPPVDPDAPEAFRDPADSDWQDRVLAYASDCCSYFGDGTTIDRSWTGLYAITEDRRPILERPRPGLVTATGFSGHGIMHAPAAAQTVGELAFGERPSLVRPGELANDREFEDDEIQF